MRILIFGGTGFVGLNIAKRLHRAGHAVTLFDLAPPPSRVASLAQFRAGDVRDGAVVKALIAETFDVIILGAAITADAIRDAAEPELIFSVNLTALVPILAAARDHGVKRVINLSSAAVYGAAAPRHPILDEALPVEPESLYAVSKFASERLAARLAALWRIDVVNLRLSALFGPWERRTGVRDTLSPHAQILTAANENRPALLAHAGDRDWIYAADVGDAILAVAVAIAPGTYRGNVFNVTSGQRTSALDFGSMLTRWRPELICRLAGKGETATINLHASSDRPSLASDRMTAEFGWSSRYGLEESVADLIRWSDRQMDRVAS